MQRNDVMRKVRALLDKADSTTFEAERDALMQKADSMMAAYAIEEFELEFAKPQGQREKPEVRVFDFDYRNAPDHEVHRKYVDLFSALARHTGCMIGVYRYDYAKVVGFKSDLDWLDWMFTSIKLHMLTTMIPSVSSDLSLEDNIVMLKETGLKWADIYNKVLPNFTDHPKISKYASELNEDDSWFTRRNVKIGDKWYLKEMPRPFGVWCTGVYTKHCEEHGKDRNYASPTVYRRSFMEGYMRRIQTRLYEMGQARKEATVGKGLVLANKEGDLREFFWEEFPDERPHPDDCQCDTCHYIKCNDTTCNRPRCVAARKPTRYREARYVAPIIDHGAMNNGSRAANGANLARGGVGGKRQEIS